MARTPRRRPAAPADAAMGVEPVVDTLLAGEPDVGDLDAPASDAFISFEADCPDCDWCSGLIAILTLPEATFAISYDAQLEPSVGQHLVIGRDLEQIGFSGFAEKKGQVCVGHPPHPAYAAINLAYQAGATAVNIQDASPGLQERMRPDLDRVKDKITVTFT